jgi:hypothetical protein
MHIDGITSEEFTNKNIQSDMSCIHIVPCTVIKADKTNYVVLNPEYFHTEIHLKNYFYGFVYIHEHIHLLCCFDKIKHECELHCNSLNGM